MRHGPSSLAAVGIPRARDIEAAWQGLRGVAATTPLVEAEALNRIVGARVFLKLESLQHTGSFKLRGAYWKMSRLDEAQRRRGVAAHSSGNHAQGVAAAARRLGCSAWVLMPSHAARVKLDRARAWGAQVVLYDPSCDDRDRLLAAEVERSGRTPVPPFDDAEVIAGQATVGWEAAAQLHALGLRANTVLVPCGGGGLAAGVGLAFRHLQPQARVYAVEPQALDDARRSLVLGRRVGNPRTATSICDALRADVGVLPHAIHRDVLAGVLTVSDPQVCAAMRFAYHELKIVLEPSGACALAALLSGRREAVAPVVVLVLSGGNVDASCYVEVLAAGGERVS